MRMTFYAILIGCVWAGPALADDDTLRDLGTTAAPGEIPKWDGTQWRNAHDNITTVNAGAGLSGTMTNGAITLAVVFGTPGTNNAAARSLEAPPVGSVVAWLKSFTNTPPLPNGWVECNGQVLDDTNSVYHGQTLPNLNGVSGGNKRFLRGSTTSGTVGGSEGKELDSGGQLGDANSGSRLGIVKDGGNLVYPTSQGDNDYTRAKYTISDIKPPFYEVVWIMRVK